MRPAIFGIGIVLLVLGLILMPLLYPLVNVDSAEDAGKKAREDEFATGTPLRFTGRVKDTFENDILIRRPAITIEGFEGSVGNIRIGVANESFSAGDYVLVEGKFYGILGIGYVLGDLDEQTEKYDSASVQKVPTAYFYLALILFIAGLIVTILGYVKA